MQISVYVCRFCCGMRVELQAILHVGLLVCKIVCLGSRYPLMCTISGTDGAWKSNLPLLFICNIALLLVCICLSLL